MTTEPSITNSNWQKLPLGDIFLLAERQYERRLAGLALARPREVAQMSVRPEVDEEAKRFFQAFDAKRGMILAGSEEEAIRAAMQCCSPFSSFWVLWGSLNDDNSLDEIETVQKDIIALRTVRKAVHWIEQRQIIRGVAHDIAKYA